MNGGWHGAVLEQGMEGLVGVPDGENTEWDPSASADHRGGEGQDMIRTCEVTGKLEKVCSLRFEVPH